LNRNVRRAAAPGELDRPCHPRRTASARNARLDEDRLCAALRDFHRKGAPVLAVDGVAHRDERVGPFPRLPVGTGGMLEEDGADAVQTELRLAPGHRSQTKRRPADHHLRSHAFTASRRQADARRLRDRWRPRIGAHLVRLVCDPDLQRCEKPEHRSGKVGRPAVRGNVCVGQEFGVTLIGWHLGTTVAARRWKTKMKSRREELSARAGGSLSSSAPPAARTIPSTSSATTTRCSATGAGFSSRPWSTTKETWG